MRDEANESDELLENIPSFRATKHTATPEDCQLTLSGHRLQAGLLFSKKAPTPSRLSAVPNA